MNFLKQFFEARKIACLDYGRHQLRVTRLDNDLVDVVLQEVQVRRHLAVGDSIELSLHVTLTLEAGEFAIRILTE
jgi:hypothetical protein